MRPNQILKKGPDGTIPFTQKNPGQFDKPGAYFDHQHQAGLARQEWETAAVKRLQGKPMAEWDDTDKNDFEGLKWPSLQKQVLLHHNPPAAPPVPVRLGMADVVNKPKAEWTEAHHAFFKTLSEADQELALELNAGRTPDAPAVKESLTLAPGPEANGAAVSQVMKETPKPAKPATDPLPAFTTSNLPEATPMMLSLINEAPVDKHPEMLDVIKTVSTPAAVRISQLKGLLK